MLPHSVARGLWQACVVTIVDIAELEALRLPLTRYCYRLLGSAADTDDAVQETIIRANARLHEHDAARAKLTTWVHRIATNICIDMLRGADRRALPMDFGPAATNADIGIPLAEARWVDPMPGARLFGTTDPADVLIERETLRIAFVALLQGLPPRQRAVLILRDVLAYSAQECAEIVDSTVPAVNSALQRARATLGNRPEPIDEFDPAQRELLDRYTAAFESHDLATMLDILREDAVTSMPPFAWWLRGGSAIAHLVTSSDACAGDRLLAANINGSAGFGQYRPDDAGVLRPFALLMIECRDGKVAEIMTFLGTGDRFAEFGLPSAL